MEDERVWQNQTIILKEERKSSPFETAEV